jgi:acyl-CoA thioesterase I
MCALHRARAALAGGLLLAGATRICHAGPVEGGAGPLSYIALGDSTGVGVGAREGGYVAHLYSELAALHPGARLLNLCGSGATTARVLAQQVPRVPRGERGVVTLGVGVNDLKRRVSAAEFGERLDAIVRGIRERTAAPIVVTNLPDVSFAPIVPAYLRPLVTYQVQAYNDVIGRIATRHRLILVDAYTPSRRKLPEHPEFFSADGFHPSDAGYRYWASVIWPGLRASLSASIPGPTPGG